MSVSIKCTKCGDLAFYNYDRSYKHVSEIVDSHKLAKGKNHRVRVKRD